MYEVLVSFLVVEGSHASQASMGTSGYGIENVLRTELKQDLAGISIRLRNEPILRQWNEDINIFRSFDCGLVERAIDVNNYYRDGKRQDCTGAYIPDNKIDLKILDAITINYQEPSVVTDVKEDFEIAVEKAKKGLISLVDEYRKKNPEVSEDEAIETIKNNIKEYRELFGMSFDVNIDNEDDLSDENKISD